MQTIDAQADLTGFAGPVFIGGGERSGKTLMRFMLSALPSLAMTRRVNMWPGFYQRYGDLAEDRNLERCLEAMVHTKHVRFLEPDAGRIRREFRQGPATYARLFALFQQHYAEREGKSRWGDQTPGIERYADPIFAAYPGAKMIQMLRDPRDCYEAALTKSAPRRVRAGIITASWLQSAGLARRNREKYPGRYKIVQFEQMVSRPEETLQEVCAFLGERYSPSVISLESIPRFQVQSGQTIAPGQSPLSVDFIGRHRRFAPKSEIAFIQMLTVGEMLSWGYTLTPIRLTAAEWIRFLLLCWPVNVLSLLAWRVEENRQHNHSRRGAGGTSSRAPINQPGSTQVG